MRSSSECSKSVRRVEVPSRRILLAVFVVTAAALGALLAAAQLRESPLDDPDPARQRPGVIDVDDLPIDAPHVNSGLPTIGRRLVVFFVRPDAAGILCDELGGQPFDDDVDVVVVVPDGQLPGCRAPIVGGDRVPTVYGMPRPRDGGFPQGYAVVDESGRLRYRTLDPGLTDRFDEVETMLRAVR